MFNNNVRSILLIQVKHKNPLVQPTRSHRRVKQMFEQITESVLYRLFGKEVWRHSKQINLQLEINTCKRNWTGHCLRREESNIVKKVLDWNPEGNRRRGAGQELHGAEQCYTN